MSTGGTRRLKSSGSEDERRRTSDEGEDDSGLGGTVSDDHSAHLGSSNGSSRSSSVSTGGKSHVTRSRSDGQLSRSNRPLKSMKTSKKILDRLSGKIIRQKDVFGRHDDGSNTGNSTTKKWKSNPVNVIVQHNPDGTVTAKTLTPTNSTTGEFAVPLASSNQPPKSFSMSDIGKVASTASADMAEEAGEEFDNVDGVFQVRRMIRDTSLELFSLPECRAEPTDPQSEGATAGLHGPDDPHQSLALQIEEFRKPIPKKPKDFKPLMVFPGGENIAEKESDASPMELSQQLGIERGHEGARDPASSQHIPDSSSLAAADNTGIHPSVPEERDTRAMTTKPVDSSGERENGTVEKTATAGMDRAATQTVEEIQSTPAPKATGDLLENADMYESITGPTTSKVMEELEGFESHDYHRLIPELGVSEGSLAAGDSVLLAAGDVLGSVGHSTDSKGLSSQDSPARKGFMIPKDSVQNVASGLDQYTDSWESNLRVSAFYCADIDHAGSILSM